MEVFGLSRSFELVTADIPYLNLQWNRKYYESGTFSIQIDASVYDPLWHFIMTHDRPEVGVVQKVQYENDGGEKLVLLSGFFAEQMLDQIVCSPRFVTDRAHTGTAIRVLCETFGLESKTGIAFSDSGAALGNRTTCDFIGDKLGSKCHSILETRELSYRVRCDDTFTALYVEVWQGLDRRQSQSVNPWQVFSTTWGNIENESVSIDDSAFANVCLVSANDESMQFEVDNSGGGERFEVFLDKNSEKPGENQTAEEFRAGLEQEAQEKLADAVQAVSIDVDNYGAEGYLGDFDLGDLVTVQLEDIGLELETRIVEVAEVFKPEGHTVSLGFGSKRISNIERAVKA